MAATGPGALDLAALVGGWQAGARGRLVEAYRSRLGEVAAGRPSEEELAVAVDRCRLHLALQWLGWSPGWVAKDGRAHDWVGEALELARRLCA
jgi:hypothetical protein